MNRATRRSILRVAAGYDECEGLIELDFSAREEIPRNLLRAWSGLEISIQCYACARGSSAEYRLSVRRHDGRQLREHWKTLQRVKEFVFPDRVGFEAYPRKDHVIDEAPMWHVWILPVGVGLGVTLNGVAP